MKSFWNEFIRLLRQNARLSRNVSRIRKRFQNINKYLYFRLFFCRCFNQTRNKWTIANKKEHMNDYGRDQYTYMYLRMADKCIHPLLLKSLLSMGPSLVCSSQNSFLTHSRKICTMLQYVLCRFSWCYELYQVAVQTWMEPDRPFDPPPGWTIYAFVLFLFWYIIIETFIGILTSISKIVSESFFKSKINFYLYFSIFIVLILRASKNSCSVELSTARYSNAMAQRMWHTGLSKCCYMYMYIRIC